MANLFTRPDTFFGVCEALGEDLGFNPFWLRIALAVSLLWQPLWVMAGYAVIGVLVLSLRLLMPDPRAASSLQGSDREPAPLSA